MTCLLLWSTKLEGAAAPGRARPASRHVPGEVLIKFLHGLDERVVDRVRRELRCTVHRRFPHSGWHLLRLPPGLSEADAIERLRRDPEVLAVELNFLSTALVGLPEFSPASTASFAAGAFPDDPQYANQWALAKIETPTAWLDNTGSTNVVVAIIDTGINYLHEDLQENLWRNPGEVPGNGIDDDGNGWADDLHGVDTANDAHGNDSDPFDRGANGYYHGTLVAGIIGAAANNSLGMAGVNWRIQLMAVRAIRSGNLITTGDELEALEYVLTMRKRGVNIRAVNMSYGGLPYSLAERDALQALANEGIILCVAAGNSGTDNDVTPNYPSSHPLPGLVAVAATDEKDNLAAFPVTGSSQYGRTSVDLAAPGLHVASTFGPASDSYLPDFFGTSAATPHVTGAVALLASANPGATPEQIKSALLESVDRRPALTNKLVSHGRLNLGRAIDHPFIAVGPPRIALLPSSQTVVLSNSTSLSPMVFGARPRGAQWLHNSRPIGGATNPSLALPSVTFANSGDYQLIVTNDAGAATSAVTRLAVIPLVITNQPVDLMIRQGNAARFSVGVVSPVPPVYQWTHRGQAVPGATNATLNIPNVQLAHDGVYSVIISNAFGRCTSVAAVLVVLVNPTITTPPISQSIVQGGDVTLGTVFTGNPAPFGVQWLQGTTPRASNTIAGFQDFFTLTNLQPGHAGTWRVRVRNLASSSPVERSFSLKVLADTDVDGLPDAWETAHGLSPTDSSDALLDHDADGHSNLDEYRSGTSPTNAASQLRFSSILRSNAWLLLTFSASSNRTYTVEMTDDSGLGPWIRTADIVAGNTNRTVTLADPLKSAGTGNNPGIYRLVTPRAP